MSIIFLQFPLFPFPFFFVSFFSFFSIFPPFSFFSFFTSFFTSFSSLFSLLSSFLFLLFFHFFLHFFFFNSFSLFLFLNFFSTSFFHLPSHSFFLSHISPFPCATTPKYIIMCLFQTQNPCAVFPIWQARTFKNECKKSLCPHGSHKLDMHKKAVQKWSEKCLLNLYRNCPHRMKYAASSRFRKN